MRPLVRRTLIVCAMSIAAGAISSRATAQSAAELEAARGLYKEGQDLEKKKDYAGALDRFKKVAEIKSTAIVRYHEGFCSEKTGKWIDALDFFARAQLEGQGDPKQKEAVEAARKAADALRARVPKIRIKITGSEASKAQVTIDGAALSSVLFDAGIPVDVGKHTVELQGADVAPESKEVTVAEKEAKEVVLEAKPATTTTPVTTPTTTPTTTSTTSNNTTASTTPETTSTTSTTSTSAASNDANDAEKPPRFAIVFGAFLQSVTPTGQIHSPNEPSTDYFKVTNADGSTSTDVSQWMKSGSSPELNVGFRFHPMIAAYVAWSHSFFAAGDHSSTLGDWSAQSDYVGIGATLNTNPRHGFGFWADLGLGERWTKTRSFSTETTLTSLDLRAKVGVAFKPARRWTIVAYLWASLGNYGHLDYSSKSGTQSIDIQNKTTHQFVGIGVGVLYDLLLGKQ